MEPFSSVEALVTSAALVVVASVASAVTASSSFFVVAQSSVSGTAVVGSSGGELEPSLDSNDDLADMQSVIGSSLVSILSPLLSFDCALRGKIKKKNKNMFWMM